MAGSCFSSRPGKTMWGPNTPSAAHAALLFDRCCVTSAGQLCIVHVRLGIHMNIGVAAALRVEYCSSLQSPMQDIRQSPDMLGCSCW